jgi:hypothetical protein
MQAANKPLGKMLPMTRKTCDITKNEGKGDQLLEEMHSAIYAMLCPNNDRLQEHLSALIDPVVAREAIIGLAISWICHSEPRTEGEMLHEAVCDVTLGRRKILLGEE